jgi:hypothetical protein
MGSGLNEGDVRGRAVVKVEFIHFETCAGRTGAPCRNRGYIELQKY